LLPSEIEAYFDFTIDFPPSGTLPYYVGPPLLESSVYKSLVDAGDRLRRRGGGNLEGVNTNYWYLSGCEATPAVVHMEDAGLGSVNTVCGGDTKLWLFIPASQREAFEKHIKKHSPNFRCS
jgi:hypothetical protein